MGCMKNLAIEELIELEQQDYLPSRLALFRCNTFPMNCIGSADGCFICDIG